jgi:hypothetical protein
MSVSMRTYGTRVMPLALALSAAASAAAAAKCDDANANRAMSERYAAGL